MHLIEYTQASPCHMHLNTNYSIKKTTTGTYILMGMFHLIYLPSVNADLTITCVRAVQVPSAVGCCLH